MGKFVIVRNERGIQVPMAVTAWNLLGSSKQNGSTRKGWTLVSELGEDVATHRQANAAMAKQLPLPGAKKIQTTFGPDEAQELSATKQVDTPAPAPTPAPPAPSEQAPNPQAVAARAKAEIAAKKAAANPNLPVQQTITD